MNQVTTGKMGIKGHVVMPQSVRELLGVDKGSTIAWVITDDKRIEVRPFDMTLAGDENEFEQALRENGLTYEDWRAHRRKTFEKYIQEKRATYKSKKA